MKYNRSLDYVALAMVQAAKGNAVVASKLFAKAINSPDAQRAIAVIEASNSEAHKATVKAKIKAASTKTRRIKASEELDDLIDDDEVDAGMDDEDLDLSSMEEIDAEFDEDEDEDEGSFDEAFAKVLANMNAKKRK